MALSTIHRYSGNRQEQVHKIVRKAKSPRINVICRFKKISLKVFGILVTQTDSARDGGNKNNFPNDIRQWNVRIWSMKREQWAEWCLHYSLSSQHHLKCDSGHNMLINKTTKWAHEKTRILMSRKLTCFQTV